MDGGSIVQWVAIGAIFIGQIYTCWRNGNQRTKEDTELKTVIKTQVSGIKAELDHNDYGLSALNRKIADFKTHCATVSTAISGRVDALEDKIE